MLNNIVDNIERCGQHIIVQGCFHQPFMRFYACIASNLLTSTRNLADQQIINVSSFIKLYSLQNIYSE